MVTWATPISPGLPADACTEHDLGIAGDKLEDFHQPDVEDRADHLDRFVEQFLQVGFGKSALTKPGDGLLLARAGAQFAVYLGAIGDIAAGAYDPHRGPAFDHHRRVTFEPALLAVWLRRQPILQPARLVRPHHVLQLRQHPGAILGVDFVLERGQGAVETARLLSVDRF